MAGVQKTLEPDDPSFLALPARVRRRIDSAFDDAIRNPASHPSRKQRKLNKDSTSSEPGGFIIDNSQQGGFIVDNGQPGKPPAPGGFLLDRAEPGGFIADSGDELHDLRPNLPESDHDATFQDERVPLSFIPTALQLLDLQPDDENVLAAFRHAASGWEDKSPVRSHSDSPDKQFVTRNDWRAVCAALLGNHSNADADANGSSPSIRSPPDDGARLSPYESPLSEDEYQESASEGSESEAVQDDSDEEYQAGGFIATKPKRNSKHTADTASKRSSRTPSSLDLDEEGGGPSNRPVTARQRQECRRTFSLFFPSVPDSGLDEQRIMIKDITRVAKLLKEKITAEEIVEMLEMFSSSADKSMNLQDFERMMITAKLAYNSSR